MPNEFFLEIVTLDKTFFSGDVEMLILKTINGELGVLKNHAPMVVAVAIGPIKIKKDGEWIEAVISEGFMKIDHDKTEIFVDTAEWPNEIDINRALAAKERAEERLRGRLDKIQHMQSYAALTRALARIEVTKNIKTDN